VKSGLTRRVAAALVVAVGLTASACAPAKTSLGGPVAAAQTLTLNIAAPLDNAQVATPFEVQLDSNVPLGAPETGLHHVHLYYDTPTPEGAYDLVYGDRAQVASLSPGVHTILASLRNANHSDAGPRALITVNVSQVGQAGGQASTAPMDEKDQADPYAY
jgi:hypothetical protein